MKIFYSRKALRIISHISRYLTKCLLFSTWRAYNVRIARNCEICKDERFSSRFCSIFTSQFLRRQKEERKATREQSRLFQFPLEIRRRLCNACSIPSRTHVYTNAFEVYRVRMRTHTYAHIRVRKV